MAESFQKTMWEEAEALLTQPTDKRDTKRLESILIWFRQRSPIFKKLEDDTMMDILRNAKLCRHRRDSIIVRQGEKGNCLYVILKGSVSVYAKKEGEGEVAQETMVRSHKERIVLFGTELATLKAGRSFGESVLIEENENERNATIISEEASILISIDGQLYRRSLMEISAEWRRKTNFVTHCSLFDSWPNAYKSLLVENLTAHKFNFGNLVVKQGTSCQSVFFIAKGMGKVIVDPCVAAKQYHSMKPKKRQKAEASKHDSLKFENDEDDVAMALTVIDKRRRRLLFGYVAEERRQRARTLHIAVIGEHDIIGDLEMVLDLPAYSTSVECLESLECYELDKPSFIRLIVKRNPETLELIRQVAIAKLKFRAERLHHIPYYGLLLEEAAHDVSAAAKSKSSRPKSVAKALVGFMTGKKAAKQNEFFRRLAQNNATAQSDKNTATAANTDDGRQSDTRDNQDRRRDKKENKKQYTAEEFRALKKKVQSTGKLIGRISD